MNECDKIQREKKENSEKFMKNGEIIICVKFDEKFKRFKQK